jgi:hypothetical protein
MISIQPLSTVRAAFDLPWSRVFWLEDSPSQKTRDRFEMPNLRAGGRYPPEIML